MNTEMQNIIREYETTQRIRDRTKPKDCFVIDHGYVDMFCDPWMASEYYKRAKQQLCLECYYWDAEDIRCQKPYGVTQMVSIIRNILWKLRWKWHLPILDRLYIYHFKLSKRRTEEIQWKKP